MRPQIAALYYWRRTNPAGTSFYAFATPLTLQIFPGAGDEASMLAR